MEHILDILINWKYLLAVFYITLMILPFSRNKVIRYYARFTAYSIFVSTIVFFMIPIFLLRPFNVINLRIGAVAIRQLNIFLGIEWELRNGHYIQQTNGAVVVANHQTMLDIMGMWKIWNILNLCTVITKKLILFVPPFGLAAWICGLVYIDKHNPTRAYQEIKKQRYVLNNGIKIWWFAEGTRTLKPEKLQPFKKGAFRTAIECKSPIIPVVYSPYYFIDSKKKTFDNGKIVMSALQPISTANYTLDDLDVLMKLTYERMDVEYQKLREECKKF